jgi:hypothetical protein
LSPLAKYWLFQHQKLTYSFFYFGLSKFVFLSERSGEISPYHSVSPFLSLRLISAVHFLGLEYQWPVCKFSGVLALPNCLTVCLPSRGGKSPIQLRGKSSHIILETSWVPKQSAYVPYTMRPLPKGWIIQHLKLTYRFSYLSLSNFRVPVGRVSEIFPQRPVSLLSSLQPTSGVDSLGLES